MDLVLRRVSLAAPDLYRLSCKGTQAVEGERALSHNHITIE